MTPSQQHRKVLKFVKDYKTLNGFAPNGHEIAAGCDIGRTYAYKLLVQMEEEGLIERAYLDGRPVGRNVKLTKAAMKELRRTM